MIILMYLLPFQQYRIIKLLGNPEISRKNTQKLNIKKKYELARTYSGGLDRSHQYFCDRSDVEPIRVRANLVDAASLECSNLRFQSVHIQHSPISPPYYLDNVTGALFFIIKIYIPNYPASRLSLVFPTPPHSTHRLYTRGSM